MTVGQGRDPNTDSNWLADATGLNYFVFWDVFVNGEDTASFSASADDSSGAFIGYVDPASGSTICDDSSGVQAAFYASTNQYAVSFPASCVGSPSSISLDAEWQYGQLDYTSPPDNGICCTVSPGTTPPPTTTTEASTGSTTGNGVITTSVEHLAITGPGLGFKTVALVGILLMILGFAMLLLVDIPRRLIRHVAVLGSARRLLTTGGVSWWREAGQGTNSGKALSPDSRESRASDVDARKADEFRSNQLWLKHERDQGND